jgi:predicted ATPase
MEQQEMNRVHRIGAQRNINISEHIPLKNYADASEMMLYGSVERIQWNNKDVRWDWGKNYTTKLIDDFDDTLAALIALHNNANDRYARDCEDHELRGEEKPHTQKTPLRKLLDIWNDIFPTRVLLYEDGDFYARVKENGSQYPAREMSDGERSVLYLAAQVLSIPSDDTNRIIIMDEPEVHLNRSLLNSLWGKLEVARPDCLFIYITYDVDFATSHSASDKVWVRDYDGKKWDIELLKDDGGLPEDLVIGLIGNRKPVLFVEGNRSGLDYAVYSLAYPDWQVVPVGGCKQVIESVKAFRATPQIHSYQARRMLRKSCLW